MKRAIRKIKRRWARLSPNERKWAKITGIIAPIWLLCMFLIGFQNYGARLTGMIIYGTTFPLISWWNKKW